jgi:hypothetical protein
MQNIARVGNLGRETVKKNPPGRRYISYIHDKKHFYSYSALFLVKV